MTWHSLPAELQIAIVALVPVHAVRVLAATCWSARALCLPAIFANVTLPSAASLRAFVRHVPPEYGPYVRSLQICTKGAPTPTDDVLALLRVCSRLAALDLVLASSLDPERIVPAFARLHNVRSFAISCWGREEVAPVSERLVVALAASLPSLTHLTMSRITRSAIHVDTCDVPFRVPIVTNDCDVPPHPVLGTDLALPNLLRLPSLRTLEIRDTWLGCDANISASSPLKKLVLTGSMYSSSQCESQACLAWLAACPSLESLHLGTPLAVTELPLLPRVSHVHLDALRILPDDLPSTMDALKSSGVESISIAYEPQQDRPAKTDDDFERECALDDLQDWTCAVETFLLSRSQEEWSTLGRINVSLSHDINASWNL